MATLTCYCCGATQNLSHVQMIMGNQGWIRYPNLTFMIGEDVCTCLHMPGLFSESNRKSTENVK